MSQSAYSERVGGVDRLISSAGKSSTPRPTFQARDLIHPRGRVLRYLASGLATLMLLGFLSFTRWLDTQREQPDTSIRILSGVDAVEIETPPPPPPPPSDPPPPPPKTPPLPKLEIQINSPAPPIKATTDPNVRPNVTMASFSNNQPQARKRMIFSLSDLDDQPKLLNRPGITFPESLRRRGVTEGRVSLDVEIHPNGQVDVLRVVECSHPEFSSIATNFATRARFSPPKKDGRPVAAKFRWPIVLR